MLLAGGLALALAAVAQQEGATRHCQPWQAAYTGDDAAGKHVIALWQFDAGAETSDASGKGHDLELKGAAFSKEGRFGGALESFRGWPDEDKAHAAVAKSAPDLSPAGPFTIEMWIKPKPDLEGYPEAVLLDKKYGDQTDYQLALGPADPGGARSLKAYLGFGSDSATFISEAAKYEPGLWRHIAFTYDAAGTGRFYRDGVSPAVARAIDAVDGERMALLKALGYPAQPEPLTSMQQGYCASADTLECYSKGPGFIDFPSPDTLDHRYLHEDVGMGLVFYCSLGRLLGVPTPVSAALVALGSAVAGRDYAAEGARSLEALGLGGMSVEAVKARMHTGP